MVTKKKVGERLRKLRKQKELTQEKLAELAKVDPKTIIEVENGKRKNPTFKTLNKITEVLKVPLSQILR